jgi:hypothetical protein
MSPLPKGVCHWHVDYRHKNRRSVFCVMSRRGNAPYLSLNNSQHKMAFPRLRYQVAPPPFKGVDAFNLGHLEVWERRLFL